MPLQGFEARGTDLGQRITAWRNLLDETRPSGQLVANPYEDYEYRDDVLYRKRNRNKGNNKKRKKNKNKKKVVFTEKIQMIKNLPAAAKEGVPSWDDYDELNLDNLTVTPRNHEHWDYGRNVSYTSDESTNKSIKLKKENWVKLTKLYPPPLTTNIHTTADGIFCGSPSK